MKAPASYSKRSPGPGEYNCKTSAEPRSRSPSYTFRGVNVKVSSSRDDGVLMLATTCLATRLASLG